MLKQPTRHAGPLSVFDPTSVHYDFIIWQLHRESAGFKCLHLAFTGTTLRIRWCYRHSNTSPVSTLTANKEKHSSTGSYLYRSSHRCSWHLVAGRLGTLVLLLVLIENGPPCDACARHRFCRAYQRIMAHGHSTKPIRRIMHNAGKCAIGTFKIWIPRIVYLHTDAEHGPPSMSWRTENNYCRMYLEEVQWLPLATLDQELASCLT